MKKKITTVLLCALLTVGTFTGCGSSSGQKPADTAQEPAETHELSATPAPKETTLALKKAGTVGDWKIKVGKVAAKSKIKISTFMEAKPKKGNLLVAVYLSVTNNGKEKAVFLPSVGRENTMMMAKLIGKGGSEYKPSSLLSYDKDLINKNIDPHEKKNGIVAFEVPKKTAKDLKSCTIRIGTATEAVIYPAK